MWEKHLPTATAYASGLLALIFLYISCCLEFMDKTQRWRRCAPHRYACPRTPRPGDLCGRTSREAIISGKQCSVLTSMKMHRIRTHWLASHAVGRSACWTDFAVWGTLVLVEGWCGKHDRMAEYPIIRMQAYFVLDISRYKGYSML